MKRLPAYLASQAIQRRLAKLAAAPLAIPLCTGSALTQEFLRINPRTSFFIDSTVGNADLETHHDSGDVVRFLYVGRLTADKGVLLLLRTFPALRRIIPSVALTIVGQGDQEPQVREYVARHDLSRDVRIVGYVPHREVVAYYRNHDVLVVPTTLAEGFPRVILEAWAKALPVIASDVGGIRGLGEDSANVLLCAPDSSASLLAAMRRLVENRDLRSGMSAYIMQNRRRITTRILPGPGAGTDSCLSIASSMPSPARWLQSAAQKRGETGILRGQLRPSQAPASDEYVGSLPAFAMRHGSRSSVTTTDLPRIPPGPTSPTTKRTSPLTGRRDRAPRWRSACNPSDDTDLRVIGEPEPGIGSWVRDSCGSMIIPYVTMTGTRRLEAGPPKYAI